MNSKEENSKTLSQLHLRIRPQYIYFTYLPKLSLWTDRRNEELTGGQEGGGRLRGVEGEEQRGGVGGGGGGLRRSIQIKLIFLLAAQR